MKLTHSIIFSLLTIILLVNSFSTPLLAQSPAHNSLENKEQKPVEKTRIIILDIIIAISSGNVKDCNCGRNGAFYEDDASVSGFDSIDDFILSNDYFKIVVYDGPSYIVLNTMYEMYFEKVIDMDGSAILEYNPSCHDNITPGQTGGLSGNTISFDVDSSFELLPDGGIQLSLLDQYNYGYIICASNKSKTSDTGNQKAPTKAKYIYPNPVHDYLNVPISGHTVITIYDQTSKLILKKTITQQQEGSSFSEINVSGLPAGFYYIHQQTGQEKMMQKFIKL